MAEMQQQNKGKAKGEEVDVDFTKGLPWGGEAHDLDPEQDAWEFTAPPPHAVYIVELGLFEAKLIKQDPQDEATWYYRIAIEGRIRDSEEYNNIPAYLRVTTRLGRGKNISTVEGALIKLGLKDKLVGRKLTPKASAEALCKLLQKGPTTNWEIDWRASYQYIDKRTGATRYKNVYNTYEDFPDSPEGGKNHQPVCTNHITGGREQLEAQLNVVHWYGKGEEVKQKAKVTVNEELEIEEPTPIKANGQASPKQSETIKSIKAQPKVIEEDEIVLE